ncbi:hypothetical protein GW796_05815 [archaeon]|nr:hypothetical protein [archaeon]NCQ51401.1 hypothetical protein [archaeon]NCT58773.1 hypothetical protein [archaeon]
MIILDGAMAMNRVLWANADDIIENPNFITHLVLSQITYLSKKFGASKQNPFVIALEGKNNWRKKYYLDNRDGIPRLEEQQYKGNRTKDTKFDWDAIYSCYNSVMESLKNYSDMYVIQIDEAEGDDVIACLTKHFKDKETIYILSSDKDFVQLQDKNKVLIYDQHKQIFKPQIDVQLFKKIHTMIGDKSDNILAIRPRLGEKTAIKILSELDDLLSTDPLMKKHWDFNQNLVDFDYIPLEIYNSIIEEFNNQSFSYNGMKLMSDFVKFNLVKHSEDINNFKLDDKKIETKMTSSIDEKKKNEDIEESNIENFFS